MKDVIPEIVGDEALIQAILEVKERETEILAAQAMCEDKD